MTGKKDQTWNIARWRLYLLGRKFNENDGLAVRFGDRIERRFEGV
jgi:hypothetical protein